MVKSNRRRWYKVGLALLVLGLALGLRLRHLDTTELWGDQSYTLGVALDFARRGRVPLTANKSSVGFMNPPMVEYLYALALWVWPDVLSVSLLTMLTGLAAVAVAGWVGYRAFGWRAGLWAALLMAVNPWSVYYSQQIWNQTLVPLFAALTLAGTILYFAVEQRSWYLVMALAAAAFMTQVHPASAVQVVALGLVFLLFWRKLRWRPLLVGGALFALLYLPYLAYQIQTNWHDLRVVRELGQEAARFSPAALLVSIDLMRAQGFQIHLQNLPAFDRLAVILLVAALGYAVARGIMTLVRRRERPLAGRDLALWIVLIWFGVPILLYLRASQYLQSYYLMAQFPAHFLLVGLLFADTQRGAEGWARRATRSATRQGLRAAAWLLVPLPLLILTVWQAYFSLRFQDVRYRYPRAAYLQVRQMRSVIEEANDLLARHPRCPLVIVSNGFFLDSSRLLLLREFTIAPRTLATDGELAVPRPAPCAVYVDATRETRASRWLRTHARAAPPADGGSELRSWRFYVDEGRRQAAGPAPIAAWEEGLALTGYARESLEVGSTLPLTLTWRVGEATTDTRYHIGTYLLTPELEVLTQQDGPRFDSTGWETGDHFVSWFEIPIPAELPKESYHVGVVVYSWPELARATLLSGEELFLLEELQPPAP